MSRPIHRSLLSPLAAVALLAAAAPAAHAQFTGYALRNSSGTQQLVRFSTSDPSNVTVVGTTGASLRGIDFRAANGLLYGYDGSQLYTLSLTNGAATVVADVGNLPGLGIGVDFNPMANALRLVNSEGTNLRVVPDFSATVTDVSLTYTDGTSGIPNLAAVAYTNNDVDPNTPTTLYGIDLRRGTLARSTNANMGTYVTVGGLGIGSGLNRRFGFDIVTVGGMNTAFFQAGMGNGISRLYQINLETGAATRIGNIGTERQLEGLAVAASTVPEPGTWALLGTGLLGLGAVARRRRS